jgi:hypothetical protein
VRAFSVISEDEVARTRRVRGTMTGLPTPWNTWLSGSRRAGNWWRSEWEREAAAAPAPQAIEEVLHEIPLGLRVADDRSGPVESPSEKQIVITALDMIVDDRPFSQVADELNRYGYKARDGAPWTPAALFVLLPRMIEIGPRLFTSSGWSTRKQRLQSVG